MATAPPGNKGPGKKAVRNRVGDGRGACGAIRDGYSKNANDCAMIARKDEPRRAR